jgi:hypothetical protein
MRPFISDHSLKGFENGGGREGLIEADAMVQSLAIAASPLRTIATEFYLASATINSLALDV